MCGCAVCLARDVSVSKQFWGFLSSLLLLLHLYILSQGTQFGISTLRCSTGATPTLQKTKAIMVKSLNEPTMVVLKVPAW